MSDKIANTQDRPEEKPLTELYKRIRQMVTMEDSLCLMQEDNNDIPTGLVIGFLESYDDFTFYYLDEILIFGEYQNKGGTPRRASRIRPCG